jgi:hypothetical protein
MDVRGEANPDLKRPFKCRYRWAGIPKHNKNRQFIAIFIVVRPTRSLTIGGKARTDFAVGTVS